MHGKSAQSPGDSDRRTVVVGYNGKPHGRQALAWAAAEAGRRDLPLLVMYAANYPGLTLAPGLGLLVRAQQRKPSGSTSPAEPASEPSSPATPTFQIASHRCGNIAANATARQRRRTPREETTPATYQARDRIDERVPRPGFRRKTALRRGSQPR